MLDDAGGFWKLAEHLYGLGHRKIAAVCKLDESTGVARYEGYMKFMLEHQLEIKNDRILWYSSEDIQTMFTGHKMKMCIRDRRTDVSTGWGMGQRINAQARTGEGDKAYRPVSYTHLDVYKRQDVYGGNSIFGEDIIVDRDDAKRALEVLRTIGICEPEE